MSEFARDIIRILQLLVSLVMCVVLVLLLRQMPPTVGDQMKIESIKDEKARAVAAQRLHENMPLAQVEGEVEAEVSNLSPIDVEVTNDVTLDSANVLEVEVLTDPVPVAIQR